MVEMVVVKSKIKEASVNCNVAGDFADALNVVALAEIKAAVKRAQANSRKTIQTKDVFTGKMKAKVMLVVKSKIKDVAKDCNVSGDFAEALNEVLVARVEQACARAEANGRKTVSPKDL